MLKSKVLITGGAGFLGSHLCDRFLKEGFQVLAMDNLVTGSLLNITHLQENTDFSFTEHNICDPIVIEGTLDFILHFASPASPVDYLNIPIQTLKVGAIGTYHVLGLARAKKATILIASTSEVYGDPKVHPQKETYWGNVNPVGERSVYDEAKRFQEAITVAYHKEHKISIRIARIFNTYGARMRVNDGRVLPAFIGQSLSGKPLTLFGDGSQTRSFCFVDDLVEGVYRLLMSDCNDPVNIGNPSEISILDFAREIIKLTGKDTGLIFKPLPQDDPMQRCPDISKATDLLGWSPKVNLTEGLQRTYAYFKALPEEQLARLLPKDFREYRR